MPRLRLKVMVGLSVLAINCCNFSYSQAVSPPATGTSTQATTQVEPFQAVSRSANQTVWQRTEYETGPDGVRRPHIQKYVELGSGLNFKKNGVWAPSKAVIEPYTTGSIARQGAYKVIFANNLNTTGAIDMQGPDGKRIRSNIIGLGYYDRATGNSILIAQLQDSTGELISVNQILYPNAFEGVNASVRYTYKRSGLEQDVILQENPRPPSYYGLNDDTTELEVMTAFISPPDASVSAADSGTADLEPDENISWGATSLGKGRAFDMGSPGNSLRRLRVSKQYMTVQGQPVLLEKVSMKELLPQLSRLPAQSSNETKLPYLVSKTRIFPKLPVARATPSPIKLASASPPDRGFVLDYVTISSAVTNYTFQGDTTYCVNGEYDLEGTTVFEGNSVIKYGSTGQVDIGSDGGVVCATASYRPAMFTSMNDNSVGQTVSGSSGTASQGDVGTFLSINCPDANLSNMRFAYASVAILVQDRLDLTNCQFLGADLVTEYGNNIGLHNVLIQEVSGDDPVSSATAVIAENVTCDSSDGDWAMNAIADSGTSLAETNCIITVGQNVSIDGGSFQLDPDPVYQTAGAGSYYLANGSPYRNVGTTKVSAALLTALRQKTTYPPVVYSNITFTADLVLNPQAGRDTSSSLDLGYHYDPLDYAFGGCKANGDVTFAAGTAMGWFELPGSGGAGYGLSLSNNRVCSFNGVATDPCVEARYDTVQEGGDGLWTDKGWLAGIITIRNDLGVSSAPVIKAAFTDFDLMSGDPNNVRDYYAPLVFQPEHCEFGSGAFGGYQISLDITNCLFYRSYLAQVQGESGNVVNVVNCTFHGGFVQMVPSNPMSVTFLNCAFDGTTLDFENYADNSGYDYYDYNAYTNGATVLPVGGANNVFVTGGFGWQVGPLGSFYLPASSPLIDHGNTAANVLGLQDFTTQIGQVMEGTTPVDIGYHYLAVPIVTVTASTPVAKKSGQVPGAFTVTRLTGDTSNPLNVVVSISGTAVAGNDYTTISSPVTIPAGQTSATVAVTPLEGNLGQGDKTVIMTIAGGVGYLVSSPASATVTILDQPTITVTASTPTAKKSGLVPGAFTVSRQGTDMGSALNVMITMSGTATAGSDYTAITSPVTIPAGQTSISVNVAPLDNNLGQGDKTATMTISPNSTYITGSPSTANVTILDEPSITVAATTPTAKKSGVVPGVFTISRQGSDTGSALNVTVSLTGTATAGSDYATISSPVTIPAGQASVSVNVVPLDNNLGQGDKTAIMSVSSSGTYIVGSPANATVTILDEPKITVAASTATARKSGLEPGAFTVTRQGTDTSSALTLTVSLSGSATPGSDYTSISSQVTIPAGQTSVNITVAPLDNNLGQGDKTVIMTVSSGGTYIVGSPSTATVTILDEPTITVAATTPTAKKSGMVPGAFTVTRQGTDTGSALSVAVTLTGTATAGSDYATIASPVTIPAGQTSVTVNVAPLDNNLGQGDKNAIMTVSGNSAYLVGSPSAATVTILDEPTITVTASTSIAEKSGLVPGAFTVTRQGTDTGSALNVTVTLTGTATAGGDYTAISSPVTIPAGQTSVNASVTPLSNNLGQGDKTVIMTVSGNSAYITGSPSTATVTIKDVSVVTIATTQSPASEDDLYPGKFTVTRAGGDQTLPLTVNVTVSGTAQAGSDYLALGTTVTIPANQSSASVTVTPLLGTGVNTGTVILSLNNNPAYYATGGTASATCNVVQPYGNSNGDGLADAMEADFGGNPQTPNPGWKTDSDGDGLPDAYEALVNLNPNYVEPPPNLPSYSICPVQ